MQSIGVFSSARGSSSRQSGERRIGKTHIVLKMRDECRSGFLPFYQDLEAVHSTAEFIRSIYGTVHQSLSTLPGLRAHVAKWSSLLPGKIGGVDLPTGAGIWQDHGRPGVTDTRPGAPQSVQAP